MFAFPLPIVIMPLVPELDVPVLKTIAPLTPDFPEFEVKTKTEPLEDAKP